MKQRNLVGLVRRCGLGLLVLVAVGVLLAPVTAMAGRTADRLYRFGEFTDPFFNENAQIGITVGSASPVTDYTFDSIGGSGQGNLQDLFRPFTGDPTYVAPGAGGPAGSTFAAEFDGDGDYLRGDRLGLPETSVSSEDYSGIPNRGFQLWVKPNAAGNGTLQSILMDTNQHGLQITEAGTWSMRYAGSNYDSEVPVDFGAWTHVMVVRPFGPNNGARMYVDGNYVVGGPGGYTGADNTYLTIGANTGEDGGTEPGTTEFYRGVVDEIEMFVMGVSTDTATDYGTFNAAEDNEIIAAALDGIDMGDLNLDGNVDGTDVDLFVAGWLREKDSNGVVAGDLESWGWGDLNVDGVVELDDAFLLHESLLAAGAGGLDFSRLRGVPEPSSLLLLAVAALGLLRRRQ